MIYKLNKNRTRTLNLLYKEDVKLRAALNAAIRTRYCDAYTISVLEEDIKLNQARIDDLLPTTSL